jgi:putative RNA 2'-phosphotransferase
MDKVRASKLLSYVLRHEPARIGITLDEHGWVPVRDLLDGMRRNGHRLTRAELLEIVATSDKQRFALDADRDRIRANQGHSVDVDLRLAPTAPPALLFHGTPEHNVEAILAAGLRKGDRHAVHLSPDRATARRVGSRRGRAVVFEVDAAAMHRDGLEFFVSANGVWLTDRVPPQYLSIDADGSG